MTKITRSTAISLTWITTALLATNLLVGCATKNATPQTLYDLGPLRAQTGATVVVPAPVSVAEVAAPVWLDSDMIFFRLAYANDQQPRPYATSRWTMPPAQLFGERLKARIAQAGGTALSATDGAINVPLLRIEMDDFTQNFDSAAQSVVRVSLRASVYDVRTLIGYKSFVRQAPAPTADASGGAQALAAASDAAIGDLMAWLAGLPLKR